MIGSRGQLSVDITRGRSWIGTSDGDWTLDLGYEGGAYDCDGPPNALVDLALDRPVQNCSPGELGARTVEILEAVYRSSQTRRPVATYAALSGFGRGVKSPNNFGAKQS